MGQKDYVGQIFNKLTILEELPSHITPNGSKQRIVKCKCSCGEIFDIRLNSAIKSGMCRACAFKKRRNDITGMRFGKLVVISMAEDYISPSGYRLARCNCHCDCGNDCVVNMSALTTHMTESCGCIKNTRGLLKDQVEYMKYYDWEKNRDFDLSGITTTSSKKVWWKCEKCGESYYSVISSQTNLKKKHGCPYCSGHLPIKGKTDLESQHSELLNEWDYEKNDIQPNEVSCFSGKKVWWKCKECGHEWKATVANRVNGSGCPKCNIENVNSFCEQAVYYYVKQMFSDAINSDMHLGVELDIYIPSLKVAIEYDGEAWHKSKKKIDIDVCKNQLCLDNGIEMIRIREPKLPSIPYCKIFNRTDSTTNGSLSIVIKEVLQYLVSTESVMTVDVDKDVAAILEQYAVKKYKNSLLACYPEIAAEWHPTKNGKLTPDKVNKCSNYKVWWLGKCGHEWDAHISDRTIAIGKNYVQKNGFTKRKSQGCPICAGKRVLIDFNDLASQCPDLVKEWHPTKNGDLKPDQITCGSNKFVWWRCFTGHEWLASPNSRCNRHTGCPICFEYKRSLRVQNIDTGEIYGSGILAADSVGLKSTTTIYKCCKGLIQKAGGYHWKYVEEE